MFEIEHLCIQENFLKFFWEVISEYMWENGRLTQVIVQHNTKKN